MLESVGLVAMMDLAAMRGCVRPSGGGIEEYSRLSNRFGRDYMSGAPRPLCYSSIPSECKLNALLASEVAGLFKIEDC